MCSRSQPPSLTLFTSLPDLSFVLVGTRSGSVDPEFNEAQRNFSTLETTTEKFIKETKAFNEAVASALSLSSPPMDSLSRAPPIMFAKTGLFTAGASFATHFSTIFHPIAGEYDLLGKHPDAAQTIKNVDGLLAVQEDLRVAVAPEIELIESRILAPMKEFRDVLKSIRKTITKRDHKVRFLFFF